jgi:hypothetical protein
MKLAIIGHSPLALEAAIRFHCHGAALTWFVDQDDLSSFDSSSYEADIFTSELGLSLLGKMNLTYSSEVFSWNKWMSDYEKPLMEYLKRHQEVKTDDVISISKRFLSPGENIPDRSRFFDLFRIIYRLNPKEFIDEQKETNPETYKRLSDEFIHSLASSIEMYQDYDLVLDLRSDFAKSSIAASGRALGESRVTNKVSYGMSALVKAKKYQHGPDLREMALVGSDALSAEILISLSHWLKEPRSNLFIITTEEEPFKDFLKNANKKTAQKLNELLKNIEDEFHDQIDIFTKKLRDWQGLDDYVQVKIPRPAEPIPRLNFFSGHNVTAIDELIDKKRMFLTLERPEFRHGKKHPDNNNLDLKTLGVDEILVAHAKKDLTILEIDQDEKGYFNLVSTRLNIQNAWENDLKKLEGIEDEIFKLFSPVDSHELFTGTTPKGSR